MLLNQMKKNLMLKTKIANQRCLGLPPTSKSNDLHGEKPGTLTHTPVQPKVLSHQSIGGDFYKLLSFIS